MLRENVVQHDDGTAEARNQRRGRREGRRGIRDQARAKDQAIDRSAMAGGWIARRRRIAMSHANHRCRTVIRSLRLARPCRREEQRDDDEMSEDKPHIHKEATTPCSRPAQAGSPCSLSGVTRRSTLPIGTFARAPGGEVPASTRPPPSPIRPIISFLMGIQARW